MTLTITFMTLFLISRIDGLRDDLVEKLKEEIAKRGNKVAYISSEPQSEGREYFVAAYKAFQSISSFIDVEYFDLSSQFTNEDLQKITGYQVVFLSGGNVYKFLKSANERHLKLIVNEVIKEGGLIIGASAGAVLLTPNISIAGLQDVNDIHYEETEAFGYVDYEFYPHYNEHDGHEEELHSYKINNPNKIYTCHDGDGILETGSVMRTFGEISELR
jgi:dipeptidase E